MADADLIINYIPHLRRYARALTGNHAAADDLVQDTLERAWTRMGFWRRDSNMRAWLFTIMHNVFINQIKAGARAQHRKSNDPELDVAVSASQEKHLEIRDLTKALQQLSHEQREVVLLIGLEQLSYGEAAKVLGIPVGTVMSRLSRGREQLRVIMSRGSSSAALKAIK